MTDFVTKDSGERKVFGSGMQRDTETGKPRFDLLFAAGVPLEGQFLTRCAELLGRGAEKYQSRNWEQAEGPAELERFISSAARHFHQWLAQSLGAPPDGEDHAAAVFFNLNGAEFVKWKMTQENTDGREA